MRTYDLKTNPNGILAEFVEKPNVKPFFDKLKKDIEGNVDLTPDELKIAHFCTGFVTHDQVFELIHAINGILPNLFDTKLVIGLTIPMLVMVSNRTSLNAVKAILGIKTNNSNN